MDIDELIEKYEYKSEVKATSNHSIKGIFKKVIEDLKQLKQEQLESDNFFRSPAHAKCESEFENKLEKEREKLKAEKEKIEIEYEIKQLKNEVEYLKEKMEYL